MKAKAILVALLMSTVILAGCTEKDPDSDGGDPTDPANDPTKGGISGLLVDDNFRPVQLKEDWGSQAPGDFQDVGFILLLETAERIETTENGEFEVLGLEPGTYTLQVAADNHEAIDRTVNVEAGEKASVTLEARRKSSAGNPVLTLEFSGFVACAVFGASADCTLDASGESYRAGPSEDFRLAYGADAHYMVIEAVASQPGYMVLEFREDDPSGGGLAELYGDTYNDDSVDNPYMKSIYENIAVYPEHNPRFKGQNDGTTECADILASDHEEGDYCSWNGAPPPADGSYFNQEALIFYLGDEDQTGQLNYNPAGARFAIKYNYVISIFLGEPTPTDDTPEDDLNDYCVYCKGYLDE